MNPETLETLTPAMQQYYEIKKDYGDAILFFRMGDFYEMFEEDAKIAHKVLGITLTSRNKNAQNPILLAGIPYHAKEKYLPTLIKAGYKVAIAEQVSDPKLKGIVKREVVRVVTPATLSLENEGYDSQESNSQIVAVIQNEKSYGFASLNLSNHIFECCEF
jgi:DNA mismatch repair protein MutS